MKKRFSYDIIKALNGANKYDKNCPTKKPKRVLYCIRRAKKEAFHMEEMNFENAYGAAIELFVRKCFSKYLLNYDAYFEEDERLTLEPMPEPDYEDLDNYDPGNDFRYLEKVAKILGADIESIISFDADAISKYYDKYAYFKLYPEALEVYNQQWSKASGENPKNLNDIKREIKDITKEYDSYFPGTYHEGADIERPMISTRIFASFSKSKELWESYFDMVETVQRYFSTVVFEDKVLDDIEIKEYNFLVTVLHIKDAFLNQPLYYSVLESLSNLYRSEGYKEFYSFAKIDLGLFTEVELHPWCFEETAGNREIIQKYVNIHPIIGGKHTKDYLLQYVMEVKNLHCVFSWSDAQYIDWDEENPTIKERTEIYLPKAQHQIKKYETTYDSISKFVAPPQKGGITMPDRELPYQHYLSPHHQMASWLEKIEKRRQALRGEI